MLSRTFVTRLKRSAAARSWMMSRMPWHSDISCTGVFLDHDVAWYAGVERRDQQIHPAPEIVAGGQADEATHESALGMEVPFVRRHGPEVLTMPCSRATQWASRPRAVSAMPAPDPDGCGWRCAGGFGREVAGQGGEAGRQACQFHQLGGEARQEAVAVAPFQVGDQRRGRNPVRAPVSAGLPSKCG